MKNASALLVFSALLTLGAWYSLQGVSQATDRDSPEVPLARELRPARRTLDAIKTVQAAPRTANALATKVPSPLQAALQAGDLCETVRLMQSTGAAEAFAAIVATMEPSPAMTEVYGPAGAMMAANVPGENDPAAAQVKYSHPGARLLWALKVGGLLYAPVNGSTENPKAAREILLELAKKDPGNAVYPLLRLALEEKLGFKREQLKATAEELTSASVYDPHLTEINREMIEASWQNPALHYAINYMYSPSVIAFYGALSLLKGMARDGDFDGQKKLARLMTESGIRAIRPSSSGDFDMAQYAAGTMFDEGAYLDSETLNKEKGAAPPRGAPSVYSGSGGRTTCDPGPYEAFFYESRGL